MHAHLQRLLIGASLGLAACYGLADLMVAALKCDLVPEDTVVAVREVFDVLLGEKDTPLHPK